jgi:hypothetical protein
LLQEIVCVHGVLGLKSIMTVKFEILIRDLKTTVIWYVMSCSLVDECEFLWNLIIILNRKATGISEMFAVFIQLRGVLSRKSNLKLYFFRGGQVIGRLDRMVKVNQGEHLGHCVT